MGNRAVLLWLCVGVCAAGDAPVACNLKAISAAERPRYNDLAKRLRIAVQDRSELPDGYTYKLGREEDNAAGGCRMDHDGAAMLSVSDVPA
jgi:hypothetical protein